MECQTLGQQVLSYWPSKSAYDIVECQIFEITTFFKMCSTYLTTQESKSHGDHLKTTGADGKSRADLPICTALSPSAKAIKVPKKNYIHEREPLLEKAGKTFNEN